jgi:hypothetical protein
MNILILENIYEIGVSLHNYWPVDLFWRWSQTNCSYTFWCYPLVTSVFYWKSVSDFNLSQRNRRPLYLKPQSVPRCKHFSSQL